MNKVLVFDMDGTIADFYGVEGWLEYLNNADTTPYDVAKPMYDTEILNNILNSLKALGWKIVVTSWLARNNVNGYAERIRTSKLSWLERYSFPYDEVHLVKYGTTKADCTRRLGGYQVLVDDNAEIRKGWHLGNTIDANDDILVKLMALLEM